MSGQVKDAQIQLVLILCTSCSNTMSVQQKYTDGAWQWGGSGGGARARDLPFVAEISAVSEYYAEIRRKHKRNVTLL